MSDEMAVSDNVAGDEDKLNSSDAPESTTEDAQDAAAVQPEEVAALATEEEPALADEPPEADDDMPEEPSDPVENDIDEKNYIEPSDIETIETKSLVKEKMESKDMDTALAEVKPEVEDPDQADPSEVEVDTKRGIKRKASDAFSDAGNEEFKGFDVINIKPKNELYRFVLERLEAEVMAAKKEYVPLRLVMAMPSAPGRASKRPRADTDGSRPSSAMSSRSDEATDARGVSPQQRGGAGRRATTEMSSPLLRAPLERGWKRELVYRAALDSHSRRNADIYYYTPKGKKLRSTREVSEHLSGTGLTLENFSFFKEPLGMDDPEKEIIRDAKLMRRVESPVSSPAPVVQVEGKRTPKPKPPKGASPEPTPKSPPPRIKVKSVGSRLSAAPASPATGKQGKKAATPSADNNNTSAWKKPRAPEPPASSPAAPPPQQHQTQPLQQLQPPPQQPPQQRQQTPPPQQPPAQSRPPTVQSSPDVPASVSSAALQPCSMSCGRGAVPSLACAACLCLYHPACVGLRQHPANTHNFLCKNCRKPSSPPLPEPPALVHKSGVPPPRRPAPIPTRPQRRVLLRMKAAGSAEGERVWSVAPPSSAAGGAPAPPGPPGVGPPAPPTTPPHTPSWRGAAPQSLAVLNGRRFVVVPRSLVQAGQHT